MLYFNTYGSQSYLTATDIMNHLNAFRDEKLPLRRFQTKTIAPLRDKIKLASHNEIDILDKAEFAGLQKLMES